jgi:hypothetical protein
MIFNWLCGHRPDKNDCLIRDILVNKVVEDENAREECLNLVLQKT